MAAHSSRMPRLTAAGMVLALALAAIPAASAGVAKGMWGVAAARATAPSGSAKNLRLRGGGVEYYENRMNLDDSIKSLKQNRMNLDDSIKSLKQVWRLGS
ncbi:hypothetical protein T484DRAFT_1817845 [Baffinella frigidus]|nr:hypothetical protein T484DRAFT_1817845 [Cryptophyta sp. CCMP2293]